MKCLCLRDGTVSYQRTHSARPASEDWVAVDVTLAGICETDLQLQKGYMGFEGIPGHEFVGVARSGSLAGKRVVGEINCACGKCSHCKQDRPRHCLHRTVVGILNHDGAFAETVWLPEQNLHEVPDSVTDEEAVFTEPLAAACRIPEQVRIRDTDQVVVLGDGRLGHLCAAVLATISRDVTVVGKHDWKLQKLDELSVSVCSLNNFQPSGEADVVVDCTGSESGFETALKTVRACGIVVLKTTVANNHQLALAPVVIDEVTVVGSRCGPFGPALKMLQEGAVNVQPLISATYPLSEGVAAFAHAQRPDALKVLLKI